MSAVPEVDAAERIANMVAAWLEPAWLTDDCLRAVAGKLVAHRDAVRGVFDALDADPQRLPLPRVERRQQRVADLDDQDAWLEELREAEDRAGYARGVLRALSSPHIDRYSRDDVDQARQDQRDNEQAHDEHAAENAPRRWTA